MATDDSFGLPPLPPGFALDEPDPGMPAISQVPTVALPGLTVPTAPKMPSATRFAPEIDEVLDTVASNYGLDKTLLSTFAAIESSGNPMTKTGSYKGLFQLSDDEFAKHGGQGDIFDPVANASAAALKLKAESTDFARRYGREPSAAELYLIHQQGVGGADAHWKNPDAPAWQNMAATAEGRQKGDNWAKKAIWGNVPTDVRRQFGDVNNITSRDFVKLWEDKVARFGGGGTAMALGGPQVSDGSGDPNLSGGAGADALPPLPSGFTLDGGASKIAAAPSVVPPLPPGFTLDGGDAKKKAEPKPVSFTEAFGRGVDQMQGMLYGGVEAAGELAGVKAVTEFGKAGRERNKTESEAYGNAAEFTKIKGVGDFTQWAKETIGSQIPIMGPMLGGAVAGAAFGPIGSLIGAFIPGFVMSTGEVQSGIKEKDPNAVAPGSAFVGGAAIAALDSILPGKIGSGLVRRFGADAAEEIAKRALSKPVKDTMLKRGAKGVVTGMATEGITEALQEAIGDFSSSYGTGKPLSPDLGTKMLEAGAAGALMGGLMGPFGGPVQVSPSEDDTPAQAPPTAPQPAPAQPSAASSVPPAIPQATAEEAAILRSGMGYSQPDIDGMTRAEIDAELADAASKGLQVPAKAADQPTAEPIADLAAQIGDLRSGARQGVYLSPDNVANVESNPAFVDALAKVLADAKGAEVVENVDGKGGKLVAKDKATVDAVKFAMQNGADPQKVLGAVTGAGTGKAANADTVVQQRTPDGAVTRETVVPAVEAPAAAEALAAPGRTVETMPAADAVKRREDGIAAEQAQVPAPTGDGSRKAPVKVEIPEDVAVAGQRVAEPTEAQAVAGNYAKGHVKVQGLDITIENPKGSIRRGKGPDGAAWEVTMPASYGYLKRSMGRDGDQVDVFIGDDPASERAFVVDQIDADTGKFDEHKSLIGFPSESEALAAYEAAFSDGKGAQRIGAVTEMPIQQFRAWARDGKKTKPLGQIGKPEAKPKKKAAPKSPDTALPFIRNAGGIAPDADLRQIADGVRIPGLFNKNGVSPDDMLRLLESENYIQDRSGPNQTIDTSLQDLYDLVGKIVNGERVGRYGTTVERPMSKKDIAAENRRQIVSEAEQVIAETGGTYDLSNAEEDRLVSLVETEYMDIADAIERIAIESIKNEAATVDATDRDQEGTGDRADDQGSGSEEAVDQPGDDPGRTGQAPEAGTQPEAVETKAPETGPSDSGPGRIPTFADAKALFDGSITEIRAYLDEKGWAGWAKLSDEQRSRAYNDLKKMAGKAEAAPAVTTEPSGQTSLVPEATTGEKIKAAEKAKDEKGKASSDDAGPLFNPDAGKQGDLVDLAKAPKAEEPAVKTEESAPKAEDSPKPSPVVKDEKEADGKEDTSAWLAERETRIKESKAAGNKHLDSLDRSVEGMRGVKFYNAHDPKERGTVRTVANTGEVVVNWADKYSADKNLVDEQTKDGKAMVWQSWLAPTDLKDYVVETRDNAGDLDALVVVLRGAGFKTIIEARKFVKEAGILSADATNKQIDETVEAAVVSAARQIVAEGKSPAETFKALTALYGNQPNLASRTGTSVANQAYSTPMPLAYVASRLAGVKAAAEVYEPTAGNGALLIEADPAKTYANEIDPDRAASLKTQGFTVTSKDGAEVPTLTDIDSVIMNPPFGAVKEGGASKVFELGDLTTTKIDHAISLNALEAMADDGKAVLIIGGTKAEDVKERTASYRGLNMKDAKTGKGKDNFYRVLYDRYNVTDHFTVSGDLYTKQGASWPVDVIVIEGRGKSQRPLPGTPQGVPALLKSWDALAEKIPNDTANDRTGDRPARKPVAPVERSARTDAVGVEPDGGVVAQPGAAGAGTKPSSVRSGSDRGQPSDGGAPQVDQGGASTRVRGDTGGTRGDAPAQRERQRVKVDTTKPQVPYQPTSNNRPVDTLIPTNQAAAVEGALAAVQSEHGAVDVYVAEKLGYEPKSEEFADAFSGEQVDTLALAIANVERGSALIVGSQTGIGKGRVAAGMLRYAIKNGMTPVFITEKPDLYGDMFRDMRDIGLPKMLGRDVRIFATNAATSVPMDEEAVDWVADKETAEEAGEKAPKRVGRFLPSIDNAKKNAEMQQIMAGEDVADVIFTTYSQMQPLGEDKPAPLRHGFLKAIAPNAMVIMDESHNASGGDVKDEGAFMAQARKKGGPTRAEFSRDIAGIAKGVMFSSATWAKRPDSMILYARAMPGAVEDINKLPGLIKKGGVPLQQIISQDLAKQNYIRHERSFEGITYAVKPVEISAEAYGQFVTSVKKIFQFDMVVSKVRKEVAEDILSQIGAGTQAMDGGVGEASATSTGFSSIMHNIVSQMLLAIKAGPAAKEAIAAHKRGEKPIITLANTNESFIRDFATAEGISIGDTVDMNFGHMLKRYLSRTLRITVKKPGDKKPTYVQIPVNRLSPDLQQMYQAVEFLIEQGNYDAIPLSPIDAIRHELKKAGMSVREITGRSTMLEYADGKPPKYVIRPKKELGAGGKRVTVKQFNSGDLDAIIFNKSGSTGVSMHAKFDFKDRRKRHMVVVQADSEINTHLQTLGRAHRTGQVVLPTFTHIAADIPAEKRPLAILMGKMASLNANTTGATGSAFTVEGADFLNEVGDSVMATYLFENWGINRALGEPYKVPESGSPNIVDLAKKATGKLVLLDIAEQEAFLNGVQEAYKNRIAELDALGENPLEAKSLDLQARVLETTELVAKVGEGPFGAPVIIEKISAKSQGRAMEPKEIAERLVDFLKVTPQATDPASRIAALEQPGRAWAEKKIAELSPSIAEQIETEVAETKDEDAKQRTRDKLSKQADRWKALMRYAHPGARIALNLPEGDVEGIVINVDRPGKAKQTAALGSWRVNIAVASPDRQFDFSMASLFMPGDVKGEDERGFVTSRSRTSHADLVTAFEASRKEGRENRFVVTGNILKGYEQVGGWGQVVNFTDDAGNVRSGVLTGRGFDPVKFMAQRKLRFPNAATVAEFLEKVSDVNVTGTEANIVLGRNRRGFYIQMDRTRRTGGKFYTDKSLRTAIAPTEFESRGTNMLADGLSRDKFIAAVDEMKKIGAAFETNTAQDEAQAIVSAGVDRAIAATGRPDQKAIENIARFLKMGRSVAVPKDVVEGSLAEIRESLDLVPSGTAAGAVSKIAPAKKGSRYDAVATIVDTDGKEHSLPINWTTLAETRAFTLTDGSLIGLFRLSSLAGGNRSSAGEGSGRTGIGVQTAESRGLIAHEAVHARRRRDILRGSLWSTLVGHAGDLRILDKEYGTYLAEIGHPDANKYPGGVTIRELYEDIYRNEPDLQERMDQESVAIMVELIEHGALMPMEVAPIETELKRVFRSAELGRSGRSRTDGGALFALDAYTGQSMRRSLDSLGFYSKALEAAQGLKQAKGTPEQMLAQLKKAGVKDAEIEATGLRAALDGKKSVTKSEIVSHLEGNRVGLTEVVRADQISPSERLSLRRRMDDLTARITQAEGSRFTRQSTIDRMREERDRIRGKLTETFPDKTRFSNYSLDPSNPTYRETVLHIPDADLQDARVYRQRYDALKAELASGVGADRRAAINEELDELMRKEIVGFTSGHFPEPNIVGHMMTSLVKHEGKPVFLIDQIQSDWGQKLRDGGVRDEKKIAGLRARLDELGGYDKLSDELIAYYDEMSAKYGDAAGSKTTEEENATLEQLKSRQAEASLLQAELNTAEAATPGNPLANTTDQWVNITLRRAIRQAAEAGVDYIAIPHGDTVLSYNPGDAAGMRGFYGSRTSEGIVPKNARKLLERMDGSIKPTRVEKLETTRGAEGWKGEHKERNTGRRLVDDRQMHDESRVDKSQTGFTLFPLTDAVRASVKTEGQPLFSAVPPALGNLDRSTQRNIEQALRDATEIVGRIAGPGATVDARAQIPIWSLNLGSDQLQRSSEVMGAAPETAGGFYRQMGDGKALIGLAFADPGHDLRTAAGHEAYHHVETVLASPQEMKLLRSPSEMERATRHAAAEIGYSIEETRKLPDYEIRAIAFQRYRRMREEGMTMTPLHIGIRRMWDAMVRLLQNVRNALRGQGFDSMESIFERARTGEMVAAAAERRIAATATPAPRVGLQRQMVPTGYVAREPFDLDQVREVRRYVGDVALADVRTVQKSVGVASTRAKLRDSRSDGPVSLFKWDGLYYVNDGNHRIEAARAKNASTIRAEVIEIAPKEPTRGTPVLEDRGPADLAAQRVGAQEDYQGAQATSTFPSGYDSKVDRLGGSEMYYSRVLKTESEVYIESIETKRGKGQGNARKLLEDIAARADAEGITLVLDANPQDSATDAMRLRALYESIGFRPASGDPSATYLMKREPQQSQAVGLDQAIALARASGATRIETIGPNDPHPGPVVAYHGTANDFDRFDLDKTADFGVHFGTPEQADWRVSIVDAQSRGRIIPAVLDIRNVITVPDLGNWKTVELAEAVETARPDLRGIAAEVKAIRADGNAYIGDEKRYLRQRLTDAGVDGIRYQNQAEGEGWSYIVWEKGRVTSATSGETLLSIFPTATSPGMRLEDGQQAPSLIDRLDSMMTPAARKARAKELGFDVDTVYYHGSQSKSIDAFDLGRAETGWRGKAVHVTNNPKEAALYGGDGRDYPGAIYPLYVRINKTADYGTTTFPRSALTEAQQKKFDAYYGAQNRPLTVENLGFALGDDVSTGLVKDAGFDSLRVSNSHLMVFDPANIRSVNADFDPSQSASPQIMASIFPTATSSGTHFGRWTAKQMRRMAPLSDQWRVRLQDKVLMFRRQQEAIERQTGSELPLSLDVYVAEALYHGKTGEQAADLQQKFVEPLVEHLRANEIDGDQLGDYLYARHAGERNAYIRTIDPGNDAGSGMSDTDAQAVLARIAGGPKAAAYAEAARMVDAMNKLSRDRLLSAGLISRETYDSWESDYQHYVPLRGFEVNEDEDAVFPRVGKGFNIRGPEAYRALGRRSKSDNPVAYVILQAQQAIVRAEKNRVNKTLLRLVESHPDPDVWQVYRGENKRVLKTDPATGQEYVTTVFVPPQFSAHDPSILGVKVGGKQLYIQLHNVNLARAMKGIGSSEFDHAIVRNMMKLTRFYAQLLTSWNPEFVIGNFFRDVQTALLNSKDVADLPEGTRKKMLGEALSLKSIRGIYNALRGDGSTKHARYFEEFRQAGGKVSFMEYNDIERIKSRMNGLLTEGKTMRAIRQAAKYVEDLNTSVENGVRLSTYIAMREAGISRDRAAYVARELTVNFNRKGEWGPIINSAYMFFNASVQGSTRMLQAIARSKAVRRAVYAIVAGGAAMEVLNYLIAGDDDDGENAYDKIKPWVKERNMIFMLPGRKDYLMIPMPYGYNVPYIAGQKIGELSRTVAGHGKLTPAKAAAGIMSAMMESFNPLGTSPEKSFLQMVSPTILDPVVQVAENKTWYGGPIFPTKFDRNKPDSETYFSSVHPAFVSAAKWLNESTGGNAARSGMVDVSPEVLEHYAQFVGGGIGKFVLNATGSGQRLLQGEEFVPEKTPIVRRLYGKQTSTSRRGDFYEKWVDVDAAYYEVRQLAKAGDEAGAREARKENAAELQAYGAMKGTQKALSQLGKETARIRLSKTLSDAEKKTKLDEIKDRENKLIIRALEVYARAKKAADAK